MKDEQQKENKKPIWWKQGISGGVGICPCCKTEITLPMDTVIYNGMGSWRIFKDGKLFYEGDFSKQYWEFPKLSEFEEKARESPESEWIAEFDLPLRDGKYQRHGIDTWVLIEKGNGFA